MIPLDYILEILENFRFFYIFVIVSFGLLLINKVLLGKGFNGLLFLTFASSIVFSIIIDLYIKDYIIFSRLIYFIFSDFSFFIIVIVIYRHLTRTANVENLKYVLDKLNNRYFYFLVFFLIINILINLKFVSHDGSSRIEFHINRWYSFVRLLNQLIRPVLAFILFFNIEKKHKRKFILLFILFVLESISAGSKSGFVFFLLSYFLIYRDIFNVRIFSSKKNIVISIFILSIVSLLNLKYMGIDGFKVFERIVHYGEATIMVYPLNNPQGIVDGQSMLSIIHRGVGRFLGDPSSTDIDTLFGYALSAEFYGANTFTGPNARIGAYALVGFPGFKLIFLYIILLVYVKICFFLLKLTKKKNQFFYTVFLLLTITGIQEFIMDYNSSMSTFTLIIIIINLFIIYKLLLLVKSPDVNDIIQYNINK